MPHVSTGGRTKVSHFIEHATDTSSGNEDEEEETARTMERKRKAQAKRSPNKRQRLGDNVPENSHPTAGKSYADTGPPSTINPSIRPSANRTVTSNIAQSSQASMPSGVSTPNGQGSDRIWLSARKSTSGKRPTQPSGMAARKSAGDKPPPPLSTHNAHESATDIDVDDAQNAASSSRGAASSSIEQPRPSTSSGINKNKGEATKFSKPQTVRKSTGKLPPPRPMRSSVSASRSDSTIGQTSSSRIVQTARKTTGGRPSSTQMPPSTASSPEPPSQSRSKPGPGYRKSTGGPSMNQRFTAADKERRSTFGGVSDLLKSKGKEKAVEEPISAGTTKRTKRTRAEKQRRKQTADSDSDDIVVLDGPSNVRPRSISAPGGSSNPRNTQGQTSPSKTKKPPNPPPLHVIDIPSSNEGTPPVSNITRSDRSDSISASFGHFPPPQSQSRRINSKPTNDDEVINLCSDNEEPDIPASLSSPLRSQRSTADSINAPVAPAVGSQAKANTGTDVIVISDDSDEPSVSNRAKGKGKQKDEPSKSISTSQPRPGQRLSRRLDSDGSRPPSRASGDYTVPRPSGMAYESLDKDYEMPRIAGSGISFGDVEGLIDSVVVQNGNEKSGEKASERNEDEEAHLPQSPPVPEEPISLCELKLFSCLRGTRFGDHDYFLVANDAVSQQDHQPDNDIVMDPPQMDRSNYIMDEADSSGIEPEPDPVIVEDSDQDRAVSADMILEANISPDATKEVQEIGPDGSGDLPAEMAGESCVDEPPAVLEEGEISLDLAGTDPPTDLEEGEISLNLTAPGPEPSLRSEESDATGPGPEPSTHTISKSEPLPAEVQAQTVPESHVDKPIAFDGEQGPEQPTLTAPCPRSPNTVPEPVSRPIPESSMTHDADTVMEEPVKEIAKAKHSSSRSTPLSYEESMAQVYASMSRGNSPPRSRKSAPRTKPSSISTSASSISASVPPSRSSSISTARKSSGSSIIPQPSRVSSHRTPSLSLSTSLANQNRHDSSQPSPSRRHTGDSMGIPAALSTSSISRPSSSLSNPDQDREGKSARSTSVTSSSLTQKISIPPVSGSRENQGRSSQNTLSNPIIPRPASSQPNALVNVYNAMNQAQSTDVESRISFERYKEALRSRAKNVENKSRFEDESAPFFMRRDWKKPLEDAVQDVMNDLASTTEKISLAPESSTTSSSSVKTVGGDDAVSEQSTSALVQQQPMQAEVQTQRAPLPVDQPPVPTSTELGDANVTQSEASADADRDIPMQTEETNDSTAATGLTSPNNQEAPIDTTSWLNYDLEYADSPSPIPMNEDDDTSAELMYPEEESGHPAADPLPYAPVVNGVVSKQAEHAESVVVETNGITQPGTSEGYPEPFSSEPIAQSSSPVLQSGIVPHEPSNDELFLPEPISQSSSDIGPPQVPVTEEEPTGRPIRSRASSSDETIIAPDDCIAVRRSRRRSRGQSTDSTPLNRTPNDTPPRSSSPDDAAIPKTYGGLPVMTWENFRHNLRNSVPEHHLARNLPHMLQDHINAMSEVVRNYPMMRDIFEIMVAEANAEDEPGAPPVTLFNTVDNEPAPPWEFHYTNKMWLGDNVPLPSFKNLKSCNCVGRCDPESKTCACLKRQVELTETYHTGFMYENDGILKQTGLPVLECNSLCGCDEDCVNRVVQNGRKYEVKIGKTVDKGWGAFNGSKEIPRGTFIGIYSGELLADADPEERGKKYNFFGRTYLFDIDFWYIKEKVPGREDSKYTVDAYHAGNFTRFLNHSCDPNAALTPVYIDEDDWERPLLTIFAKKNILPDEEITFSYHGDPDNEETPASSPVKGRGRRKAKGATASTKLKDDAVYTDCRCGSARCKGIMFGVSVNAGEDEDDK
ncbi:hypothetical protein D9758_005768 [Tetrapyrgos nigripes]|uniref:Uncharacterized protein n=1 Tax=Tetrapyrgos nigripes TaxID=182062 RepID=A0A8H5GJP9_9AGAR|nr:hypothetical protein D9758_005768 [Tetrapyrgos nigripes]